MDAGDGVGSMHKQMRWEQDLEMGSFPKNRDYRRAGLALPPMGAAWQRKRAAADRAAHSDAGRTRRACVLLTRASKFPQTPTEEAR